MGDGVKVCQGSNPVGEVAVVKMDAGEIAGYRVYWQAAVHPASEGVTDSLVNIPVDFLNAAIFLKDRDKGAGSQEAAVRVVPPHQRLTADDLASDHVNLWLKIGHEFVRAEGGGQPVGELFTQQCVLPHLAVIQHNGALGGIFRAPARVICQVKHELDVLFFGLVYKVDAKGGEHRRRKARALYPAVSGLLNVCHPGAQGFPVPVF